MVKIDNPLPTSVKTILKHELFQPEAEDYFFEYVKNGQIIRVYNPRKLKLGYRPTAAELLRYGNLSEASERWRGLIQCQKRPFYALAYGTQLASWLRNPASRPSELMKKPYAPYTKGYYQYLYEYANYKKLTGRPLPDPVPNALAAYWRNKEPATGCIIIADAKPRALPDLIEIIDQNGRALKSACCPHLDPHEFYVIGPSEDNYYPPWKYGYGCQFWGEVAAAQMPNLLPLIIAHDFRVYSFKNKQWYYAQNPNHFSYSKELLEEGFYRVQYLATWVNIYLENLVNCIPPTYEEIQKTIQLTEEQIEAQKQAIYSWFEQEKNKLVEKYQKKLDILQKQTDAELGKIERRKKAALRYLNDRNRDEVLRNSLAYRQEYARILKDAEEAKAAALDRLGKTKELLTEELNQHFNDLQQQYDKKISKIGTLTEEQIAEGIEKIRGPRFTIRLRVKPSVEASGYYQLFWGRVALPWLNNSVSQNNEEVLIADISYISYKHFEIKILKYLQPPPPAEELQVMEEPWSYSTTYPSDSLIIQEPWSS